MKTPWDLIFLIPTFAVLYWQSSNRSKVPVSLDVNSFVKPTEHVEAVQKQIAKLYRELIETVTFHLNAGHIEFDVPIDTVDSRLAEQVRLAMTDLLREAGYRKFTIRVTTAGKEHSFYFVVPPMTMDECD